MIHPLYTVRRKLAFGVVGTCLVVALTAVLFACSQTPTSVPVRTFERAQRMDVACLRLWNPPPSGSSDFTHREPIGRPSTECQPIPPDVDGLGFEKQLFALVTQTTRGELAVVDLSAGSLVDQSRAVPGINFIPVGALPTDVATSPDGKMVFVASAETNKPAIYGIPTRRIMGDAWDSPDRDPAPNTLAAWPVCALPQSPGAITVVPRATPGPDSPTGEHPAQYDIVVVLPGDRENSAKVLTLDPRPFRRGGLRVGADGKPDYASDRSAVDGEPETLNAGPILEPGSLRPCGGNDLLVSAVELAGPAKVPTSFVPGPAWDDGVKYVDGGIDLTCKRPEPATNCGLPPCCGTAPTADGGADGGADAGATDGGACEPLGPKDAGSVPLDLGPLEPPHLVSLARDERTLYIADQGVPLIHVVDMSTPTAPRELPPLVATSLADPSRVVEVKGLALSPPTRDYKRFLYAIDRADGSLMVYDVTDPATTQRTPQLRPNPELNPFQPADRLAFNSPVVAVAFARHDVPLGQINGGAANPSAPSGVLCNPNPHVIPPAAPAVASDLGYYYRNDVGDPGQALGPRRLRGIFGFATLASGLVVAIDVDDWDSPCRRPVDMSTSVTVSDIAPPQPDLNDQNPYHAPTVVPGSVSNEAFFPMSAPHSLRSEVLITNDATSGNQVPRVDAPPTVASNGVVLPQLGTGSEDTPLLSMRFAFEQPQVHIDQGWAVVYEPALPGFTGLSATIETRKDTARDTAQKYWSLVFHQPEAHFCVKGVEDFARGQDRVHSINAALAQQTSTTPLALPPRADRWMSDYVQLTDDLLDVSDSYWGLDQSKNEDSCWEGPLATASGPTRHDTCASVYGSLGSDQKPTRDFPIVEAYDDRVVVGRFFTFPSPDGTPLHREVVFTDPTNVSELKLMQCCFHHQANFAVRTGQLWGAIGQSSGGGGVGFLSHLTTDSAGRCVPSCDPRESLLNGRLPTVPAAVVADNVDKNSPLALRNPMFSAVMVGGSSGKDPLRDTQYSFSTLGGFRALNVSIGGASIAVSPQSMRYIDSLGQVAVVDGASQGLVLIDLQSVTVARAPYF